MRQAEIDAESHSIYTISVYKKFEKHQFRAIEGMRKEQAEIDFEEYEENLEFKVEELKTALLDIEIKLGDALRTAYGQFETRLKALRQKMIEVTNEFSEQAVSEAQVFARAIKFHGMESHEALKNHFELITDDK
jgi:hypothetical protein